MQKSGENPEQAVVRKLLEETNIKDKFIKEKSNKGVSFEKGNSLDKKSLDKRGD
ncbi:NUDIX hydrolase [Patescibacteria group bacterium]|nr:NUDIX hydrolase [Patescibacteria group bacterium]